MIVHDDLDVNDRKITDDTLISDLMISVRAEHCLTGWSAKEAERLCEKRLQTVGDLKKYSDAELLRLPNLGKVTLAEIRQIAPYTLSPSAPVPTLEALHKEIAELRQRLAQLEARPYDAMRLVWNPHGVGGCWEPQYGYAW